jgi:hypothetical protein
MSDDKISSPGRLFKVVALAAILGVFFSGLLVGSCLALVAWVRVPELFHAPVGFKHTPLVGISAVADSALGPLFMALVLFWLPFWALLHFFPHAPGRRRKS